MLEQLKVEVIEGVVFVDGKALVDGSYVHGGVTIENADIESLPDRLTVFGALYIIGCPKLKKLPDRLVVEDGLLVEDCPNLALIGREIYAGTFLAIEVCPKLSSIPEDMVVHGHLGVHKCGDFKPFTPGMNQASNFATEDFSLDEGRLQFFDPIPESIMAACVGKTLRSVFDIPMLASFPEMDRTIVSFTDEQGFPTAQLR